MFFALLTVALFGCSYGNGNFNNFDFVYNEQPCLETGGVCVIEANCPTGNVSESKGLCPEQQSMGVKCCYGLNDPRCESSDAYCLLISLCNDTGIANEDGTNNCEKGQICCII